MTNPQSQERVLPRAGGRTRKLVEWASAKQPYAWVQPTVRALIVLLCVVASVVMLVLWHAAWDRLQEHLISGGTCNYLAELQEKTTEAETTALGTAGLSFAVLPVIMFNKSTTELLGLFFVILSTWLAFLPAAKESWLDGPHRVAGVVTLGVVSLLVFVVAFIFRWATEADAADPPPDGKGYVEGFWHLWTLTVTAMIVIVALAITLPLISPFSSTDKAAADTVTTHLDNLKTAGANMLCGGGRPAPEAVPTAG